MAYTKLYLELMHGRYQEALESIRLRKDLDTPCGSFGNTPLHISAEKGLTQIVLRLLEEGVDANVRNKVGETPLHLSVMLGHEEVTELLLNAQADSGICNAYGETPFNQRITLGF